MNKPTRDKDQPDDTKFKKVVQHFLKSPPSPRQSESLSSREKLQNGDHFLIVEDKIRIAHKAARNEDGSITADLYQNLDDYRSGRMMERDFTFWR